MTKEKQIQGLADEIYSKVGELNWLINEISRLDTKVVLKANDNHGISLEGLSYTRPLECKIYKEVQQTTLEDYDGRARSSIDLASIGYKQNDQTSRP